MPPFVSQSLAWLRHTFAWSNSRQSWQERLGLAAWLAAAVAWFYLGDRLGGPLQLTTAAGLVLALALLARRGWLRLFGPVLFYEVIRSARRGRYILLRWLYAVGLLLLLVWVHSMWNLEQRYGQDNKPLDYKMQAQLAEQFFAAFAVTQFIVVVLLTPAYVAGSIAEEKERKTLEFLLATDLRNREIVFGKLLARAGNLILFVLTGLPVLSLMQFFGGIDPGLLLATYAVTALTAASLTGLGILNSVLRRRARDAIVITYLAAIGYVIVASLALAVPPLLSAYRAQSATPPWALDDWTRWAVEVLNYGNPIAGLIDVMRTIGTGGLLADTLTDVLQRYALFHGTVAVGCVVWAVVRLRSAALATAAVAAKPGLLRPVRVRRRPPVGERPMLWKEVRVEGGLRFGWLGRILVGLLVLGSFVPVVVMAYFMLFDPNNNYRRGNWEEFSEGVNVWLRVMNVLISVLMLLGVAVRAAGSVSGERDRDTLVSLMTTTLSTQEIWWGKWAGSLLSVRLFLVWLGVWWAVGLVTGAVGLPAILLEALAWLAPATCFAAIGLYYSAACATTLRATTWTLLTCLFAGGGHWLCTGMCCFLPLEIVLSGSGVNLEWAGYFELGLTPPFVFGLIPYRNLSDITGFARDGVMPGFLVLGMFIWVVAAAVIGHLAHERFQVLTHRDEWQRVQAQAAVGKPGAAVGEPRP